MAARSAEWVETIGGDHVEEICTFGRRARRRFVDGSGHRNVAQEKIKIGVVTDLSGAYISPGSKYLHFIDAFFQITGTKSAAAT